jgi:D-beta-D-heptose 7-phosphate kinase/D-beta-D-heptose 1-phosphate adenosyltransferase
VAVELASAAAETVVRQDGTLACAAADLRDQVDTSRKVVQNSAALCQRIDAVRRRGSRIVFTNGCFDVLHRGHVTLLSAARSMGDILVVGLNSDSSVRQLKGDSRPLNPLSDRAHVLAALSCVDLIIPFEELTPVNLIRTLRPDVFVKGADYSRQTLPEAELVETLGGSVHFLPIVADHSTTGLIQRIQHGERLVAR